MMCKNLKKLYIRQGERILLLLDNLISKDESYFYLFYLTVITN